MKTLVRMEESVNGTSSKKISPAHVLQSTEAKSVTSSKVSDTLVSTTSYRTVNSPFNCGCSMNVKGLTGVMVSKLWHLFTVALFSAAICC